MTFQKGNKGFRAKESYETYDKSFFKSKEYREKMRRIAIDRGYGKWMIGKKQSTETIAKRSAKLKGHRPFTWSGDRPEYHALHKWLHAKYGKPTGCQNAGCESVSPRRIEYALIKGREYTRERSNYVNLCVLCHRRYDRGLIEIELKMETQ